MPIPRKEYEVRKGIEPRLQQRQQNKLNVDISRSDALLFEILRELRTLRERVDEIAKKG